jgi:F-type H+-transporting ATPase subunit delta
VLIDHHRVDFLGPIVKQFGQELNQRLGFTEAAITSVRALNEPERHSLEAEVEKLTGRKVLARYSEDPTILGGAIVRIGSTIYDGSVKGTLERIREQLSST